MCGFDIRGSDTDECEYVIDTLGEEAAKAGAIAAKLQILESLFMYEHGMFEFLHYRTKESGLPYGLWFDDLGKQRPDNNKTPRVKIGMPGGNLIPVSIDKASVILHSGHLLCKAEEELNGEKRDEMFRFISEHYEIMLKHWYGDVTNMDMLENFEK